MNENSLGWPERARINVVGIPRPKGSLRAFQRTNIREILAADPSARVPQPIVTAGSGKTLYEWVSAVKQAARFVWGYRDPPIQRRQPVDVTLIFRLQPPKKNALPYPTNPPDVDKLQRAVLDALTGIVWLDDAQIVHVDPWKIWADDSNPPGVIIIVRTPSEAKEGEANP